MKISHTLIVVLSFALLVAVYEIFDQAVSIDHLKVSIEHFRVREKCLHKLVQAYLDSMGVEKFRV